MISTSPDTGRPGAGSPRPARDLLPSRVAAGKCFRCALVRAGIFGFLIGVVLFCVTAWVVIACTAVEVMGLVWEIAR